LAVGLIVELEVKLAVEALSTIFVIIDAAGVRPENFKDIARRYIPTYLLLGHLTMYRDHSDIKS